MRTPSVSVLLPVKRPDPVYFPEAVRSILGQTLADFELLVVEAAGGPPAPDVLGHLADPRIRWLRAPDGATLVDQLNQGLAQARGRYVARMDADDVAARERLARQVQRLQDDPGLDVVGSQLRIVDTAGRVVGWRRYPTQHAHILAAMRRFNPIAHPAATFRRDAVLQEGGYRGPDQGVEDYDLWCRMALRGRRFANLPDPLLDYRIHPGSVKSQRVRDTLRATVAMKRAHFAGCMSAADRLWLRAEEWALRLPPGLVLWLFRRLRYAGAE